MTRPAALVLGATGGIGGQVARTLLQRGWRVRALHRDPVAAAARRPGLAVEWVGGDAMDAADVSTAARGASVIVHAVNPPGYRDWHRLVLPMLDHTIAAARTHGARIVLPGNVYNHGPDAFPLLREDSPQHPVTRKGRIRVEMEQRLARAATTGVRSLVVRAGDFFGPDPGNAWFSQALVKPGRPVTSVTNPNDPDVGHAWAYLPDVAETMVRLIEREADLAAFETFHMAGHWDAAGDGMARAIVRVAGRPGVTIGRPAWWLYRLMSPFITVFREMQELRYLWQQPVQLDNRRLVAFLGAEPHTPLDEAVRTTLQALGCLDAAPGTSVARA
ncbi:NAD(P)H-binding protein [Piscinibacter gummiphilus]|nr:NAD(P)H-binding protein [Piscinibacter gummiphilus]GLS93248.1 membrane protein [Piscinibacter gummiphilus]